MGLRESTKRNAQLTRQNDIFYVISSFYLKCTEFKRYWEFCSNCESLGTQTKLVKFKNSQSTLGKI